MVGCWKFWWHGSKHFSENMKGGQLVYEGHAYSLSQRHVKQNYWEMFLVIYYEVH
jgi:hypothetical protein